MMHRHAAIMVRKVNILQRNAPFISEETILFERKDSKKKETEKKESKYSM